MLENNQIKQPILLVKAASNKLGKKKKIKILKIWHHPPSPTPFLSTSKHIKGGKCYKTTSNITATN